MEKERARFLAEASQQLFQSSPSTSAHLSFERMQLQRHQEKLGTSSQFCQACGTLSVPGLSSSMSFRGQKKSTRQQLQARPRELITSHLCLACGRKKTSVSIQDTRPPKQRDTGKNAVSVGPASKTASSAPTLPTVEPIEEAPKASEPKLSSKKRAKARKDREGLQALLTKSKSSASSSAFSFQDLMKK